MHYITIWFAEHTYAEVNTSVNNTTITSLQGITTILNVMWSWIMWLKVISPEDLTFDIDL